MPDESEAQTPRPELPMRLTRLRVKNFRSIADIDIPLSPLTVLVGPNGSGKSNVVDALRFVRDVFARGLDQAVMDREGMGVIQRWGTEGEGITIGFSMYFGEKYSVQKNEQEKETSDAVGTVSYEITFRESDENTISVERESLLINVEDKDFPQIQLKRINEKLVARLGEKVFEGLENRKHPYKRLGQGRLLSPPVLFNLSSEVFGLPKGDYEEWNDEEKEADYIYFQAYAKANDIELIFKGASFYSLNPSELRMGQQVLKSTPFDEKGRNLAAVLRHISQSERADWNGLRFALRQAVAGFDTLEVEPVGGYLATKLIYQTDTTQPRTSYLGQESDGTIRMLGILAALYQDPAQPFLSIEEPEANIHPGALAVLASVLDEASLRSQVLVTTHSPDMLDHLPAESFLVVEKVGDTTHVGPLDAGQLASVRKRLFTPGELLRMEGLQRQTPEEPAS